MSNNKKVKKKKKESKFKVIHSCHADIIRTQYSDEDILIEFGESPPDDDGYLPSCRVYMDPKGTEDIVKALSITLKDFNKQFKKKKK